MFKQNISVKFFIHLVSERPALWDKTSGDYKDRSLKETSWREICAYMNEDYYSLSPKAREDFTKMMTKKWTHIRDSWVKSMKYGCDERTSRPAKPYIYHNELKFMQKILKCKQPSYNLNRTQLSNKDFEEFYQDKNETQHSNGISNELDNSNAEEEAVAMDEICVEDCKLEPNASGGNNETKETEDIDANEDWPLENSQLTPLTGADQSNKSIDLAIHNRQSVFLNLLGDEEHKEPKVKQPQIVPPIKRAQERPAIIYHPRQRRSSYENRHWNFFKGILPSLSDFDEDHILKFQSGVIGLVQKLRESQKQKTTAKLNWQPARSNFRERARKRKNLRDNDDNDDGDYDDEWETHNSRSRRRSTRRISDPIGPEDSNIETEYSMDN